MTLLLLAGTSEARQVAARLTDRPVLASLAGAVSEIPEYPVPTRTGGFGGEAGFLATLETEGITAVLDATHPFAARITERTARLCQERGLPYARLSRPAWQPQEGYDWREARDPEEACRLVPPGARAFLATGAQEIERYAGLDGKAEVLCRRAEATADPFPFEKGRWIVGRGPFDLSAEIALFRLLGIDVIVTKNAGGAASRAKLDAARTLRLPVVMIARPSEPEGVPVLRSVDEAVTWARSCA